MSVWKEVGDVTSNRSSAASIRLQEEEEEEIKDRFEVQSLKPLELWTIIKTHWFVSEYQHVVTTSLDSLLHQDSLSYANQLKNQDDEKGEDSDSRTRLHRREKKSENRLCYAFRLTCKRVSESVSDESGAGGFQLDHFPLFKSELDASRRGLTV